MSIRKRLILLLAVSFAIIFTVVFIFQGVIADKFAEVKEQEIKTIFSQNIAYIDRYTRLMETGASMFASAGVSLYHMKKEHPEKNYDKHFETYLMGALDKLTEAFGGGIWYELNTFDENRSHYAPYTYRKGGVPVFTWNYSTGENRYHEKAWYQTAIPMGWDKNRKREKTYYWTEPYLGSGDLAGVVIRTVNTVMYNAAGRIIGLAEIDWALKDIVDLLNSIKITENSQSFLIDDNYKKIIFYTLDDKVTMKKRDQIGWLSALGKSEIGKIGKVPSVMIDGREYTVFHSLSDAGLEYGIMIPEDELMPFVRRMNMIGRVLIIALFAGALFVMMFFITRITSSILRIVDIMRDIAEGEGDLTVRIEQESQDEIGQLSGYFNDFVAKIENLVKTIKSAGMSVLNSSQEVSNGNTQLSSATQEMASSLEQTAASVEEITSSIEETASKSSSASRDVVTTASEAEIGAGKLKQMNEGMKEVKSSGHKIQEIVAVVNNIAFQTNLLALNAAVEASRAGEEGKGFAVVAAEVRTLAARSAEASSQIAELIDENESHIEKASSMSDETVEVLLRVVERIRGLTGVIQEVGQMAKQQAEGINQINTAVTQMDEVTQRNAALVEELASSAEDLHTVSRALSKDISQFRVGMDDMR